MIGVGCIAGAMVLGALLVPEGEIVTLVTDDVNGKPTETQLWVVDVDDTVYLRAGSPRAAWLDRLRADPDVELARPAFGTTPHGGYRPHPFEARVIEDPAIAARIGEAMSAKYGNADRLWGWIADRKESVVVRLDAREPEPGDHP